MASFKLEHGLAEFRRLHGNIVQATDEARRQWARAYAATREAQQMSGELQTQIEELAQDGKFRKRYRDTILERILAAALRENRADMGNIQILDPKTAQLVIQFSNGFRRPFLDFFNRVESGQAACGVALLTGMCQLVEDTTSSEIFQGSPSLEALLDANVRAVISAPLLGRAGQVVGVISTHFKEPRQFDRGALNNIAYLARKAAAVIEWHDGNGSGVANRVSDFAER